MVLQKTLGLAKLWSNFTGESRSLFFFIRSCLGVSNFHKAEFLKVPIRPFICFYLFMFFSLLYIEFFNEAPTNFRENVNPNFF